MRQEEVAIKEMLVGLGKNIASIRKQKGYSQLELSILCDVSKSYLCDVEHGRRNVSIALIEKIALALGTSFKEIFAGIGPSKKRKKKSHR